MSGGRVITGTLDSQLYPILQNDDDVAEDVAVSQKNPRFDRGGDSLQTDGTIGQIHVIVVIVISIVTIDSTTDQ
jgi:hypothetical protein